MFNLGVEEIATILGNIKHQTVNQIASTLKAALNVAVNEIAGVLRDVGYSIQQIGGVLQTGSTTKPLPRQHRSWTTPATQIDQIWVCAAERLPPGRSNHGVDPQRASAEAPHINDVLEDTYHQSVDAIGNVLSSIGFSDDTISDIGEAFDDFGDDVADFFGGLLTNA